MVTVTTDPSSRAPSRPPFHRGHWLLGALPELSEGPHLFLEELCARHGDVVALRLGPLKALVVRDPADVEHVLIGNRHNWVKTGSPAYETLKLVLGEGLVTSEGDTWLKHRRLMQPAFHRERLEGFARTMAEEAQRTAMHFDEAARTGAILDVAREMILFTQRVVLRTILSVDADDDQASARVADALAVGLTFIEHRTSSVLRLPLGLPLPSHRRFHAARAVLDEEVRRILDEKRARRAHGEPARHDLLEMLMDAVDEETGAVLDDRELFDEVMTLFLAGHETTSNLLSWTFALLGENPGVEEALVQELVDEPSPGGALDLARVMRLPYLGRVISESLRVRPPVWTVDRMAASDDVLGGYAVPAGALVFISPWVVHRNPALWPEPERFDPDRFLPENEERRHKLAFIPFIAGQRKCIGDQFALMEARIALSTWLPRFRVRPLAMPDGESVVTLRPRGGLPARIERRPAPAVALER